MRSAAALLIAIALLAHAAGQGGPAPADGPLAAAREAFARGDMDEGVRQLESAVARGDAAAANALGEAMLDGRAGEPSPAVAKRHFETAVAGGDPAAHFNLATLLTTAPGGVERDLERARFLLEVAAEKGHAPAQFEFGRLLESEIDLDGPAPDWSEARSWIERAATAGYAPALFAMVRYADAGLAGGADPARGTGYCVAAAKGGSAAAMNEMGLRYQAGKGLRPDNVAAAGWFLLAAQHGFAPAQVNLGKAYAEGDGLRQDYDQAGQQFAAAAKAGYPPGEFMLAQLFERGLGTEADLAKAFALYTRAAEAGLAEAEERRAALDTTLTAEQRAAAEAILAQRRDP